MTDPSTGGSRSRRRPSARRFVVGAATGVVLLLGCTEDGQLDLSEIERPDVEAPGGEAPEGQPPEEPPAEEPPAEEPPADDAPAGGAGDEDADDDGLTTEEWILLIVLGVGLIAVIIGATSAASSHSEKKSRERSERQRQVNDVVGGSRWVLDQGTTMVLTPTDGGQVQSVWASVRPRVLEMEQSVARYGAGSGDDDLDRALSRLGVELGGLRSALDSYVSAVASDHPDLVEQARVTVNDRRRQVDVALQPIAQVPR